MQFSETWSVRAKHRSETLSIRADFFIDATGSPELLNRFLGIRSGANSFKTNSRALFTHFTDLKKWEDYLSGSGIPTKDYPYRPDYSALHHLLEDAWMWMLRFNDDRCSAGIMLNREAWPVSKQIEPKKEWSRIIDTYPSLLSLLGKAEYAKVPGRMIRTGRLQRKLEKAAGSNWAALPHTAGFVDPMHSTGIAHTLSGIEKVLDILVGNFHNRKKRIPELLEYQQSVFIELEFIDTLVAGSYEAINYFTLFNPYVMLYFIAAIRYEQSRLKGDKPSHFLHAGNPQLQYILNTTYTELQELVKGKVTEADARNFRKKIIRRIQPYNTAGLLDPMAQNMYHHTAVEIQ